MQTEQKQRFMKENEEVVRNSRNRLSLLDNMGTDVNTQKYMLVSDFASKQKS